MAVVDAPALSLAASGNLGAICYSSWRGLNIARDVWTGTVPNTSAQQVIQAYLKTVAQAWSNTLSMSDRSKWCAVASKMTCLSRIKTKYVPTGYQIFVQYNVQRKRLGRAIMNVPPHAIAPYTWQIFRLGYNYYTEVVNLHFEDEMNVGASEFSAEIWRAGPFDNGGRHAIDGEYRFLKYIQPIGSDTDGSLTVGKYYWYKARVVDDYGRVQNWFEHQIFIPTQASGQIVLNADFSSWSSDDPVSWSVVGEDSSTYVTEGSPGADIIGVLGTYLGLNQYPTFEIGIKYILVINNTRVTGLMKVYVQGNTTYLVSARDINTDNLTVEFDVGVGETSGRITIYKTATRTVDTNITLAAIYRRD